MKTKSDNELIEQVKTGSGFAFEILRKRYAEKLKFYIVYSFKFSEQEAEDIINEVFFKLYKRQFTKYHFNEKFSTYLYKAIKNEAISLKRSFRKRFFTSIELNDKAKTEVYEETFDNKEFVEFLFKQVTLKERELIILKDFNYLSYNEISKITNIKETTLRANHHRALKKMKDAIKERNLKIEDFI